MTDRLAWADDYAFLNSITKYPSIPTWHVMGDRGRLTPQTMFDAEGPWLLTEKIDGTNARVIVLTYPTDHGGTTWFIGSREELLWASGDRLHNPSMGIVDVVRPVAAHAIDILRLTGITVAYGEVYGHKINHWQPYTAREGRRGFRVFDVQRLRIDVIEELWRKSPTDRSLWRESNDPTRWYPAGSLGPLFRDSHVWPNVEPGNEDHGVCQRCGAYYASEATTSECNYFDVVPSMGTVDWLPDDLAKTLEWLTHDNGPSGAFLDDQPPITDRRPEGIVARTADRSRIVKMRVEDYERTLKVQKGKSG